MRPMTAAPANMPSFCRHNRLIQNCPICSKEQSIELRPIVTSSAPRTAQSRPSAPRPTRARSGSPARASGAGGITVRRVARGADDGYRSPLVIGLKSSEDAGRLAGELAFAAHRLARLENDPPGLYRDVADAGADIEERSWLAFLIAYLCPLGIAGEGIAGEGIAGQGITGDGTGDGAGEAGGEDPFAEIERVRTSWASGELPSLEGVRVGPRSAHNPSRGTKTLEAYRTWAARAGSQAAAYTGDAAWAPERRFARAFERLALPGLHRDARFDLLVTLGWLGVYEMRAGSLALGGPNDVTVGAKRAFGIGDPLLLERRASDLARACEIPLEVLDVGLDNWQRGERATLGLGGDDEPEPEALWAIRGALRL
jgi:hypothetical protein